MFSCDFYKTFKKFFYKHLRATAFEYYLDCTNNYKFSS